MKYIIITIFLSIQVQPNIVEYLDLMYYQYRNEIEKEYKEEYKKFTTKNRIQHNNTKNKEIFYKLFFYHKLFTTNQAIDCAKSGILEIPYFWISDRHRIEYTKKSQLRERIPKNFLEDLVSDTPTFSHPDCGKFYTFGWCSEREMSYTAILKNIGFTCKIKAAGAHCWTTVSVKMLNHNNIEKEYTIKIDNTFETFYTIPNKSITVIDKCKKYDYNCSSCLVQHYFNRESNNKISHIIVKKKARIRIQKKIENHFIN